MARAATKERSLVLAQSRILSFAGKSHQNVPGESDWSNHRTWVQGIPERDIAKLYLEILVSCPRLTP